MDKFIMKILQDSPDLAQKFSKKFNELNGWEKAEEMSYKKLSSGDGSIVFVGADWDSKKILVHWDKDPEAMIPHEWFKNDIDLLKIMKMPMLVEDLKNHIIASTILMQIRLNYDEETRV